MVQQTVDALYHALKAFGGWLQSVALLLAVVVAILALLGLGIYWRDSDAFDRARAWFAPRLAMFAVWSLTLLLVIFECTALVRAKDITLERAAVEEESPYSMTEEAPESSLFQYGPVAAYLTEHTYTRTVRIPAELAGKVQTEGLQTLGPYLQQGISPNIVRTQDSFKREGRDIVFTRELTMLQEVPIVIDKGEVKTTFRTRRGAHGKPFYSVAFDGRYTFRNPTAEEVTGRFVFTLPSSSGTISDLQVRVGDTPITEPNESGNYSWEGTLAPGAQITAVAHYQASGGTNWTYNIGSGRRRTGEFRLVVDSDSEPRYIRRSLFPNKREGEKPVWELKNVITSQNISLAFPQDTTENETLVKVFLFLPLALAAFFAWLTAYALIWRDVDSPHMFLGPVLMGLGYLAVPILLPYLALQWVALIGCALGAVLALISLLFRHPLATLIAAFLPLAMLVPDHSGLIILAAAILAAIGLLKSHS